MSRSLANECSLQVVAHPTLLIRLNMLRSCELPVTDRVTPSHIRCPPISKPGAT